MNYLRIINELYTGRIFYGKKRTLERMRKFINLLGNPQDEYESIHVTGTNGKGSVSKVLFELLRSHGFHAGLYTSPHLSNFRERIRVDDERIGKDEIVNLMEQIEPMLLKLEDENPDFSPTFFDVVTAMAFMYFKIKKVDVAVVEVGVGGRLDSTNVIRNVKVGVITSVGLDHTKTLGNTIEKIAWEKAGIIKEGMDLVCAETRSEVVKIVSKRVEEKNARFFLRTKDYGFSNVRLKLNENRFDYLGKGRIDDLLITLNGYNQIINTSTALFAFERFMEHRGKKIEVDRVKSTLRQVKWMGRFEVFQLGGKTVVMDGAHNPSAMEMLAKNLNVYFPRTRRIGIVGIIDDKDRDSIMRALDGSFDGIVVTNPMESRTCKIKDLMDVVKRYYPTAEFVESKIEAFKRAMKSDADLIVITGSLYLVGYLRDYVARLERNGR